MTNPTVFTNLESRQSITAATAAISGAATIGGALTVTGVISEAGTQKVKTVEIGYIDKNTATATAKELWTLPAGCAILQAIAFVETAFAGSTEDAVILGTTGTADALLAAADITEGTVGIYAKDNVEYAATATKIYATYTRTGTTTAGKTTFYVTYIEL